MSSVLQRCRCCAGYADILGVCLGLAAVYTPWRIVSAARRAAGAELHPLRAAPGAAPAAEKVCRALGAANGSARTARWAMRAHRSRYQRRL